MRIFLYGNEERAKWHLPVVEAKFRSFVANCKARGLKQDRFTMNFEEDGTVVFGQYFYGSESIQIYSPGVTKKVEEKSTIDLSSEVRPKIFWVNTTKGYYWVEVRYPENGAPIVILTAFSPYVNGELLYPIIEKQTAGMLSTVVNGLRAVVTQGAGVFTGHGKNHGTAILHPSFDGLGRITPNFNNNSFIFVAGDFESKSVGSVTITAVNDSLEVEFHHNDISLLAASEDGRFPLSCLVPNPIWVHRKCAGSYFSPNKTIGYHVDIGADEEYMGNMSMASGLDLLDTTGIQESLFNHTPDMARIVSMLNFPVNLSDDVVDVIFESPTMFYTSETSKRCWGGYLFSSWEFGCADYQRDFNTWYLAPRMVKASFNLKTGTIEFTDIAGTAENGNGGNEIDVNVLSWDVAFSAKFFAAVRHKCDTTFYEEFFPDNTIEYNCDWEDTCSGTCGIDDETSYSGECAKIWDVKKHRSTYAREELEVSRHAYFLFGSHPSPFKPESMRGFYFMFDGLWHLDVGLHWATQKLKADICNLCSTPQAGQDPGGLIWFYVGGSSSAEHIASTGHEYVENLEIVTPLGFIDGPYGFTVFGFVARVPEEFAAPHEPVVLTGGIRYISQMDADAHVECEKHLMSTPCECDGNELILDGELSYLTVSFGDVAVDHGCPPFSWYASGANIVNTVTGENYGHSLTKTEASSVHVVATEPKCGIRVIARDACNTSVSMESKVVVGDISGPDIIIPGTTAVYELDTNTDSVVYSGNLELISQNGNTVVVEMPADACGGEYSVTLSACGISKTRLVRPTAGRWQEIGVYSWPSGNSSGIGIAVYDIFSPVPGYMEKDYDVLICEAYSGKYKCGDSVLSYRTATIAGCASSPRHFPVGTICVPGTYAYGTTVDCQYFHEYYLDGIETPENSRGSCANGPQGRTIWEWRC